MAPRFWTSIQSPLSRGLRDNSPQDTSKIGFRPQQLE